MCVPCTDFSGLKLSLKVMALIHRSEVYIRNTFICILGLRYDLNVFYHILFCTVGFFLSYMDKPLALNNRINNYNILGDYRENASLNETLDDVCEEKNQNNESFTKGLFNTIFSYMNQSFQESKFQTYTIIPENKLIQGSKVDFLIKGKNILTSSTNKDICFVEVKPLGGSI